MASDPFAINMQHERAQFTAGKLSRAVSFIITHTHTHVCVTKNVGRVTLSQTTAYSQKTTDQDIPSVPRTTILLSVQGFLESTLGSRFPLSSTPVALVHTSVFCTVTQTHITQPRYIYAQCRDKTGRVRSGQEVSSLHAIGTLISSSTCDGVKA